MKQAAIDMLIYPMPARLREKWERSHKGSWERRLRGRKEKWKSERKNIIFRREGRRWRRSGRDSLYYSITHESNGSVFLQSEKKSVFVWEHHEEFKKYQCDRGCMWNICKVLVCVFNVGIVSIELERLTSLFGQAQRQSLCVPAS